MPAALRTLAQLWAAIGTANDTANFALNDPVSQSERLVCDIWATNPSALSLNPDAVADGYNTRCAKYYDELGTDAPAPSPPPFTGGQCAGVEYNVTFTRTVYAVSNPQTPITQSSSASGQGPVSLGPLDVNTEDFAPFVRYEQRILFSDGSSVAIGLSQDAASPPPSLSNINVVRDDGAADNCGNPPTGPVQPVPSYPRPPSFNPDGTVTPHPDTGDTTVNIDTRIDIDGGEYIEVTGPGFEYVRSPGFTEPRLPENQPDATDGAPSQPTGDGGEVTDDLTPEEEDEGLETIGYAWSLSNYPSNAGIVQDTDPDVFFSPLGNVQLVYDVNGSDRFSDNLPIRAASGTIIRNDASLKVRAVRFNKRPDVGGITLTPIRRARTDAS